MSNLYVDFQETEELINELRNELNNLSKTEDILKRCVETLDRQNSPTFIPVLYDEVKSLKEALINFEDEKIKETIDTIENACEQFKTGDIDGAQKIGESDEVGN